MPVHLVTVATDTQSIHFTNWKNSALRAGWSEKQTSVLGAGVMWGGWHWRCKQVSAFCAGLQPHELVVFCDAYDLLVFGAPDEFANLMSQHPTCQLLVGVERMCIAERYGGNCAGSIDGDGWFVNGGAVMGLAAAMAHAYDWIGAHHTDDQVGWFHFAQADLATRRSFAIEQDKSGDMVCNCWGGMMGRGSGVTTIETSWLRMLEFFVRPHNTMQHVRAGVDGRPVVHGTRPLLLHTPGSRWDRYARYNYIGSKFFGYDFMQQGWLTSDLCIVPMVLLIALCLCLKLTSRLVHLLSCQQPPLATAADIVVPGGALACPSIPAAAIATQNATHGSGVQLGQPAAKMGNGRGGLRPPTGPVHQAVRLASRHLKRGLPSVHG